MATSDQGREEEVLRGLQETLNTHGYGFQNAVLRLAHQLIEKGESAWDYEVSELPVEVRGFGTRIDFVLRRRRNVGGESVSTYYMLAECKRANPAYCDWCFVHDPYYPDYKTKNGYVVFDRATLQLNERIQVEPVSQYFGTGEFGPYHVAVEVKGAAKGDSHGSAKGVIEEAATQILRGLNGMIEFLADHPSLFSIVSKSITLVPVIFTTARLWASDVDLGAANLTTGNLDLSKSGFEPKRWLLYEYTLSPGLKHAQPYVPNGQKAIRDIVERDYVRTIVVVSAAGIEDFLKRSHWLEVG